MGIKHLVEIQLQRSILLHMEDRGLLLVNRHVDEGVLIKLTVKCFYQYKNVSDE